VLNRGVVLLPQFAVDGDILLDQAAVGFEIPLPPRMAGTTRPRKLSSRLMVLLLERLGERQVIEFAGGLLAPSHRARSVSWRIHILVVAEREERDAQRGRIGRRIFRPSTFAPASGKPGTRGRRPRTPAHVRWARVVHNHLGAAKVDVGRFAGDTVKRAASPGES
jgi:hypothetical protein